MHIRNLFLRVFPDACGAYANSPILAANHLELYAKEGRYGPGRIQAVEPSSLVVRAIRTIFFALQREALSLIQVKHTPTVFMIALFLPNLGCSATPQKESTGEVARSVKGVKSVKNDMHFKSMPG